MPRGLREAQIVEHLRRAAPVVGRERRGIPHEQQVEGPAQVDADKLGQREARAAGGERGDAPRRGPRDAGEGVAQTVGVQERVVRQGPQAVQVGVGAAQDRAQVVVLPEERVEPPTHRRLPAPEVVAGALARWVARWVAGWVVRQVDGPRTHPAAEGVLRLEERHGDPALGEDDGRGEPGDPAPDDEHMPQRRGRADRGRRRVMDDVPIPARSVGRRRGGSRHLSRGAGR